MVIKTIKDAFPNMPKDESDLVKASVELWKLGSIDEIKDKVSPELFIVHVSMNMIGNHQCDGWRSIFYYHSQMLPYIPNALDALCLTDLKSEFNKFIAIASEFFDCDEPPEIVNEYLDNLDSLFDSVWGYSAPQKGWGGVLKYIQDNL